MKRQLFIEIVSGLLILLFTYTAVSKLAYFESFKIALRLSPLIGTYNEYVAWVVPLTEIVIVILLFIPGLRLTGLVCSLFLLLAFSFYIGYLLLFMSENLPCSCGGVLRHLTFREHLLFNTGFILLTMISILLYIHSKLLLQQAGSKLKTWTKSKQLFIHL